MTDREHKPDLPSGINRVILRTRVSMVLERLLRAFWPAAAVAASAWALISFGILELGSPILVIAGLVAVVVTFIVFLVLGKRSFQWPSRANAIARLDASLPGRPISSMQDSPVGALDDPEVAGVWLAHVKRMAQRAANARPVRADMRLARFDPWALRLAALVLFGAAVLFSRGDVVGSVAGTLTTTEANPADLGPSYEGWAEPPLYTGKPTIFLPEVTGAAALAVPEGTSVTIRAYGATGDFELRQTVSAANPAGLEAAADGIALTDFQVAQNGQVELLRDGDVLAQWTFDLLDDAAPTVEMAGEIDRSAAGEIQLPFTARDDYGVTRAQARIELDLAAVPRRHGNVVDPEPRPAIVVDLPLPLSGGAQEVAETLVEDFSKHTWVGLPVKITLLAEDALEQTGRQVGIEAELPGRRFYDPLAAAVAEQRRDILWSVENGRRVAGVLRAVTHRPDDIFDSPSAYLIVRKAIRQLEGAIAADRVAEERDIVAEALWKAALLIEEGSLGDAAQRLAKAKERLSEALRNGASDAEIAQLMDELREATRDYLNQMAREAIERGDMQSAEASPPGQSMTQDQIQRLMDRIQELSDEGRKAEAQALLERLQQMLENMEMQFAEGGGQGQGGEGQQSMQDLADALREQQGLADESFQQLQREFRQGQQQGGQQPGGQQGQGGESSQPNGGVQGLADRQDALRGLVEGLESQLPGSAGEGTQQALEEARRNMEAAEQGLRDGNTAGALDRQAEAIDSLREGMRSLSQDLAEENGGETGAGDQNGQASNGQGEDPLGRPAGVQGSLGTNRSMLPEGEAAARARSILDEIRRRSGDRARPQVELDYLRRLLDRF